MSEFKFQINFQKFPLSEFQFQFQSQQICHMIELSDFVPINQSNANTYLIKLPLTLTSSPQLRGKYDLFNKIIST